MCLTLTYVRYLQGRNRGVDGEKGLVETAGEGEGIERVAWSYIHS